MRPPSEDKKNRERVYLCRFAEAIGQDPRGWTIDESERPDFRVRLPDRQSLGIELTELLTRDHGKDRSREHAVCSAIREEVARFVGEKGGTGALIHGSMTRLPRTNANTHEIRSRLRAHLDRHGFALGTDQGSMEQRFDYEWGFISQVDRYDSVGRFDLYEDRPHPPLAHKAALTQQDIEAMVVHAVEAKARRALTYDRTLPVWLALRNRYSRVHAISIATRVSVQQANKNLFARIVVFNDPEDVVDARPPGPRFIDLLQVERFSKHSDSV